MKKNHRVQVTIAVVLVALLAAANLSYAVPPAAGQPVELARTGQPKAQTGEASGNDLSTGLTTDEQATILDLIREAQYQFTWQMSDGVWAYRAPNRANDLALSLAADGFHAVRYSAEGEPLWDFALSLAAYGQQTFPDVITEGSLIGDREQVEYHWSQDVIEWYTNSAEGVEHGLTLAGPPAGAGGSTVELAFALRSSLTPELDGNGRTLYLKDATGETVLLYDQLTVHDATGRSLPSYMCLSQGRQSARLHLVIDTAGAAYPLTVDPLLHSQVAKLTASDAAEGDRFGYSVAISGDTVIVGAPEKDGGGGQQQGAAYLFEHNRGGIADTWGEVTKLVASEVGADGFFGRSVAISGDIAVVGARGYDCPARNCGAVYIFERNQDGVDSWGQVKRLIADDAEEDDYFGASVAISVSFVQRT